MIPTSIFSAQSRASFSPKLSPSQRYRYSFGDKRLQIQYASLLTQMCQKQSVVVNQLSRSKAEQTGYYRFLTNSKVTPSELIYENTRLDPALIQGKDILVIQDQTSISFRQKLKRKPYWQQKLGVVGDNSTPGIYANCSLSIDWDNCSILGLGDIALYSRPLNTLEAQEKRRVRTARRKLSFEQQESSTWVLGASNCQKQCEGCRRLTFVMDQGSDSYEVFARILADEMTNAIWRSRENRQVLEEGEKTGKRLADVLEGIPWSAPRTTPIRPLNHYSKSKGKWVERKGRNALIKVRYAKVQLALPSCLQRDIPTLSRPIYVVQAMEDPSTVPPGEEPVNWRLLTSWEVGSEEQAWQVVEAYQARWFIEQVFRVLKKQGLCIEESQLKSVHSINNQIIMSISTTAKIMQLTLARDGNTFIPIETMFDEEEQSVLSTLNEEYSGKTQKQSNPHHPTSLAYAAWVIGRMGGWKGYQSNKRPPGPITMKRGLEDFEKIMWGYRILKKRKDV